MSRNHTRKWSLESRMLGNGHVRFGSGAVGKGPVRGHLANGLPMLHISPELWDVLTHPRVRLATSYYSDDPLDHAAVTKRPNSHARTRANIVEALRRGIPLRVGIVDVHDGQRVAQARAELESIGVMDIGHDKLRQVGRGIRDRHPGLTQLCGNCASGVLAVSPHGEVWPCVFCRWLPIGDVRVRGLKDIVASAELRDVRAELTAHFRARNPSPCRPACDPTKMCDPQCQPYTAGCHPECNPSCGPRCNPISCRPNCLPPRR